MAKMYDPRNYTYDEMLTAYLKGERNASGMVKYGGRTFWEKELRTNVKSIEAEQKAKQRDYNTLKDRIEVRIASGELTEAEGLAHLSDYVEENLQVSQEGDSGLAGMFAEEYGPRLQAQRESEKVQAALKDLGDTITEQLGEATTEALGILRTGEFQAVGPLQRAKEEGIGFLETGEEAAVEAIEAGLGTAEGEMRTGARGAFAEGRDAIEGAREDVAAATEAGIGELKGAMAPWQQAGEQALARYEQAFGMGGEADLQGVLENLPGFQFRMEQGMRAATRVQAARGQTLGGRALQELQATGQGIASEEFGRYLGGLQDLMGRGQRAAEVVGTGAAALRGQEATTLAGLGTAEAGLYQAEAGMELQAAGMTSDILTRTAAGKAGLTADIAGRESAIKASFAGQKAALTMGAAQDVAKIAAGFGQQAAGISSDFYKMTFSADLQKDMLGMQQSFEREMQAWKADLAKDLAKTTGMYSVFSSVVGAGADIYTAQPPLPK